MLKVGVIGLGVGEKHANVYANDSRCQLTGICDFNHKKLKNLKSKYPNVKIYKNDRELIDDSNIDLISIASYDNYHHEQVINAIKKNKHVMVEKPVCLNKKELDSIIKEKEKNKNIRLSSNLVLRTNPKINDMKREIMLPAFGSIYYFEADYFWGRTTKFDGWRSKMDYYSIILGAAIHMIDLVIWMLGSKPISVFAMGNDIGSKGTKLKYNSFAIILLKFSSGLIAKVTGNGPCVYPHFHGIKVFGSKKTLIHNFNESFCLERNKSKIDKVFFEKEKHKNENKDKIISNFIDLILNPKINPIVEEKDVYDAMCICLAAEESVISNRMVKIKY